MNSVTGQKNSDPSPSSSQPSSPYRNNARTRQTVEQELRERREALKKQSEKYGLLNCYDLINRPNIFPQQDLRLIEDCVNLKNSMATLQTSITRLEEELKSLK